MRPAVDNFVRSLGGIPPPQDDNTLDDKTTLDGDILLGAFAP
ncbi:MAG TPA: hypothetical protein VKB49_22490 [Candidatus Sulfotelmatobacter sp.]|nr:hypothetical protein [Candidatus Sulfotelmatobacter sp.]